MAASALGGLALGLSQGLKLGSDLQDAEDRRARLKMQDERLKVQDERDAARFDFEKKQIAEKESQIQARAEYVEQLKAINDDALNGRNGFEQFGYKAPATQQGAIAGPGGQSADTKFNPYKATADGMYANQRAADRLLSDRRAAAMESLYARIGQPEKAAMVRSQMADLFDKDVERKVKTALVSAALGAPGSLSALSNAYSYLNDGQTIDTKSATWDAANKTWKNVTFLDSNGAPAGSRDLTQADLFGMAKQDASAIAMFNIEQGWRGREYNLKDRATKADEKRADSSVITANAAQQTANDKSLYWSAYANYLNKKGDNEKNSAEQEKAVRAVGRMFPLAAKEYKPEELMLDKDRGAGKLAERDKARSMFDKTLDLKALNPSVDIHALGRVARDGWNRNLPTQEDAEGRIYTVVGKTKVYLQ